jgi:hypothetical protein
LIYRYYSLTHSNYIRLFILSVHLDFSKADWCVDPKNLPEDYEEQQQKDDGDEKDVPENDDDDDSTITGGQTNIGAATCRSGGLQLFPFVGEDSAQRMLLRQEVIDAIPANLCNITDDPERKRKNVILVVGDGMGWEMTRSGAIAKQVLDELKSLGCDTTTGCPDNQDAIDAFKSRSLDDYYTEGMLFVTICFVFMLNFYISSPVYRLSHTTELIVFTIIFLTTTNNNNNNNNERFRFWFIIPRIRKLGLGNNNTTCLTSRRTW